MAAFLDSNILVYAFTDGAKGDIAAEILARGCATSVQGLNEFANVARRKLGMTWNELEEALSAIRTVCPTIVPLDVETHLDGLRLAQRYAFSLYDAMMVAAALRAHCMTFWSEDMQNGMIVDDRMTILDPFRNNAAPAL